MTGGRAPSERMRESLHRRQLESLQFLQGELGDSIGMGAHASDFMREDRELADFERRSRERNPSTASSNIQDMIQDGPPELGPPAAPEMSPHTHGAICPAHTLGSWYKLGSRPLTVASSNTSMYLTTANAISFPGRRYGRSSSMTSLPSVRQIDLPQTGSAADASLGGPSTFRVEAGEFRKTPLHNSYTLGYLTHRAGHRPGVADVVEARYPGQKWCVPYN